MKCTAIGVLIGSIVLGGCSVSMAAKKRGVSIDEATKCNVRACFLSLRDSQVVSTQTQPDGTMVETYKILLEQGSTGRAVMHGLLDVATLGIWEVAGTPIEGSANKDQFTIITATYDLGGKLTAATFGDRGVTVTRTLDSTPSGNQASSPTTTESPKPTAPTKQNLPF